MKKEYLKPEIRSVNVVVDNMIAKTSNKNESTIPPGEDIKDDGGFAVGRTEGSWDKIWK